MNYKEVIESRYNREAWQQLLHDIFRGKVSFWNRPSEVHVSSRLAKQAFNLGKISLSDGESIAVYEVELTDNVNIERNRRGIRDMLTTDWRNMGYAGAFMFCYRKNESVLRFSYVSETWGFNKQGDYEKISTDTKRYTYLLGEGRGCRTAIEQFKVLRDSKQALSDITAAFSVEALTKQFYKDLFEWYQWAVEPSSNITFPNNTITEDDDRDDIETKVIRMITRIMFVWFIKQKNLVPDRIFDIDFLTTILKEFDPYSTTVGNYYNAILQNLFFGTLNRAIQDENGNTRKFATSSKRDVKTLYRYAEMFSISEQEVINLFAEIPFLNGGLFECLDKTKYADGVEQCYNFDGFSRNDARFADGRFKHRAVVPNNLFFEPEKGLISILGRYNFTIEENSPEEQQVALDPELLGKVFENLLGAYNPETKETARNQSGSFYTPREIVNYMVDESLIAYLGDNAFVRSLFRTDFTFDKTKTDDYQKTAEKLKAVKVLDPACGSGAFPMGLLNRMIDILERISPDERVYDLKLSVIENCLYGSDIQSIAAQITKLRFFISLICDCEKDASKPNFGIPTLPNLETKFVSANSLIAKKKKPAQGNLFENPEIEPTKNELAEIRHKHFSAKSASTKHRLREKDQTLREKLAKLLSDDDNFAPEDAKQLAAWNPYDQNAVSPFFDPEWMFGVADGFDIVIGNPPYIQLQNNGGELAKLYENCNYSTFARTGDIYCLFYERGWQLLKKEGHLCYITSNKWMRAGYGEKTREFFANKTNPMLLIDFAGVKIFESATVDTNILLFSKSNNLHETVCAVTNKQNKDSVKNLSDFVQQQNSICDFSSSDSWVILSPIEQSIKRKIEAVGTPLKDWDIQINYGIKTGFNDAFIISTEKRNEILSNCKTEDERKRTAELIRPILRGRDIKRYGYDWANLYLIATFPSRHYDIDRYPAVKQYLLSFGIERLEQTGKTHVVDGEKVKARKKTNNKWFETQDSISYWED
ncbi:MAG: Eco57I restriction-modification methylase domain-containing protein, partial [Prevotella sp.]|nr:Eco57I restriction-modification methylase domain-containing protein [Prevotella sp.]